MADGDWWFNLNTHAVEQDSERTKAADRLGPYGSRDEAERALDTVAARNEAADRGDAWGDEDD